MREDIRNTEFLSQTGRTLLTLRELLLKGEFRPGERLSELALVSRLGVSRTPIRLCLDRLAQEGLVEPSPSGGFVVNSFTLDDIWDAIEMRGVLEGTAARLAAERLTGPSDLDKLRDLQVRMDTVASHSIDSFAEYMNLNHDFHIEFLRLARSPMLERTLAHLTALPFAGPSAMVYARSKLAKVGSDVLIIGQEQHHGLLEAIEHRQGARAEAIAREHALVARRILESVVADKSMLQYVPGAALIEDSIPSS